MMSVTFLDTKIGHPFSDDPELEKQEWEDMMAEIVFDAQVPSIAAMLSQMEDTMNVAENMKSRMKTKWLEGDSRSVVEAGT